MAAPRVLVIEDDPHILELVDLYLRRDGLSVLHASDGMTGLAIAERARPDLVVLDLMLPDLDGFEVCRRLVSEKDLPVLILTARGDVTDRVSGFRMGAEDYVVKPFAPEELLFRIRALLRRSGRLRQPRIVAGAFQFDGERMHVEVMSQEVPLTRTELEVLGMLAMRPGHPFTRGQLLEAIWGDRGDVDDRAVDTCVTRLRRKLQVAFLRAGVAQAVRIETVWGIGYKFVVSPQGSGAPKSPGRTVGGARRESPDVPLAPVAGKADDARSDALSNGVTSDRHGPGANPP